MAGDPNNVDWFSSVSYCRCTYCAKQTGASMKVYLLRKANWSKFNIPKVGVTCNCQYCKRNRCQCILHHCKDTNT